MGTRKVSKKRATENELGKSIPETNGDWDYVWRQAMDTGRSETVSMLYISLDAEGRRIICSRNPHLKMGILTTVELWTIMESTFIRQRNGTFDRYMLLTTKQSKVESIEHVFGILKELSENCDLGNQKDTLIRDLFIAIMQNPEIQRELLRKTLEPPQALRLAINMALGQQKQLTIYATRIAFQCNNSTTIFPSNKSTTNYFILCTTVESNMP